MSWTAKFKQQTNKCLFVGWQTKGKLYSKADSFSPGREKIKCNPRIWSWFPKGYKQDRTTETYAEKTTKARIKTDCFYTWRQMSGRWKRLSFHLPSTVDLNLDSETIEEETLHARHKSTKINQEVSDNNWNGRCRDLNFHTSEDAGRKGMQVTTYKQNLEVRIWSSKHTKTKNINNKLRKKGKA